MVCEYVDINPRVEKKPQVKKICGPIEQTLLQGTHCLGLVSSWRTTVHKCRLHFRRQREQCWGGHHK